MDEASMNRILAFLIFFTFHGALLASPSCPPSDVKALDFAVKKYTPKKIIFFASWCKNCKDHLTNANLSSSIFVAAFDERTRAENVMNAFFKDNDTVICLWDAEQTIVKKYKVKGLPFEVDIVSN